MKLPAEAQQQLSQFKATVIARGQVFFLPHDLVQYGCDQEPHSHPCLVAFVDAGRAHLIPGTSQRATGPALVVEVGETDLDRRTEFDFRTTFPLALRVLADRGNPMGQLRAERLPEIDAAARASGRPALRRLLELMDS